MRYPAAFLAILCVLAAAPAVAQEAAEEPIETDRDSFTPSLTTAGCGRLIVESAYSFIDNRDSADTHSFPELLARYGVSDWLELRVGANYEVGGESSGVSSSAGGGIDQEGASESESEARVFYGFKAALTDQEGLRPRTAVILQGATPTSGPETATHLVATYAWGWTFFDYLTWDSSIRYGDALAEEDHFNRWAPSTVLKAALTDEWHAHIEYFEIYTDGREGELSQSYVSPGVHYLVTPDFEVGVRVGWGVEREAADFFSNVGVGLRY